MSHKADRLRAESGQIWRDGRLWPREDWEKLHPRIVAVLPAQFLRGNRVPEVEEPQPSPYFCSKCKYVHRVGSKIYEAHKQEYESMELVV